MSRRSTGGVEAGDAAGTLTVLQDGDPIDEIDLVAAEDVPAPSPFEWVMVQFDRLVRWGERPADAGRRRGAHRVAPPWV